MPIEFMSIIAERISARHWIVDGGPRMGSYMFICLYVCMYVCHAFEMQLRLSACAMAALFVLRLCMYLCIDSPPCVHVSACMHALQLMYQYLDYNTSKMRWCILSRRLNSDK